MLIWDLTQIFLTVDIGSMVQPVNRPSTSFCTGSTVSASPEHQELTEGTILLRKGTPHNVHQCFLQLSNSIVPGLRNFHAGTSALPFWPLNEIKSSLMYFSDEANHLVLRRLQGIRLAEGGVLRKERQSQLNELGAYKRKVETGHVYCCSTTFKALHSKESTSAGTTCVAKSSLPVCSNLGLPSQGHFIMGMQRSWQEECWTVCLGSLVKGGGFANTENAQVVVTGRCFLGCRYWVKMSCWCSWVSK